MRYIKTFEQFINEGAKSLEDESALTRKVQNKLEPLAIKEMDKDDRFKDTDDNELINMLHDEMFPDVFEAYPDRIKKFLSDSNYRKKIYDGIYKDFISESIITESNVANKIPKDLVKKDKYKKGDTIYYKVYFPPSGMMASSKGEMSKSTYVGRISKVLKHKGPELSSGPIQKYEVGYDTIAHSYILGTEK